MCIKYCNVLFSHFIEIIHTEATLFCESWNYINRLCKTWIAVNDSQLMVAERTYTTLDLTAEKNFSSVRYGEAVFQISWRSVHK